ncbi:MAG: DUF1015 family protein [Gammaproteobacteria bacterium]|nr:DUF1015 family protein [Gammaproteobacteria bacterium]
MPTVKAFDGYLVKSSCANQVVSPAYDSVSPAQRRAFADENPDNFLNTMRLLEDFHPDCQPTQDELLALNRRNLERLLTGEFFDELDEPCLFVYQLVTGEHIQTGLVCEVSVEEYEQNRLRKHENTRSDKEDLLADYQKVVGASSSPICLTYNQNNGIDQAINLQTEREPNLEFVSEDNVIQKIWCVKGQEQEAFVKLFESVDITYLTDGHHRAASGRRYAEIMREEKGNLGDEPYNQLLVALFPDTQLNLLPFHRCVKDSNGLTEPELLEALKQNFSVSKLGKIEFFEPRQHGEFGMLFNDKWFQLNIKPGKAQSVHPVNSLDVSVLQSSILDPILGITDIRSDSRLDYIAGVGGAESIHQKMNEGWEIVFTCYATSIDQLMDVADADELMPPKSTYFDPKPRSGIFVRLK